MYPNNVPDLVDDQSNLTSIDNSYDAVKKVEPAFFGQKKRGVKPVSNIKADKSHENWYLACEDYQKLASQDINMNRLSFLNSSYLLLDLWHKK